MRIAALIFGLLAGICGLGVMAMGNIEPDLAANALLGEQAETIARWVLLGLPALCFFTAGLALGAPRFGSVLLLLAAIGWAVIAWLAGHGAIFLAALPFTFAAAAGIVAAFGHRQVEETFAAAHADVTAAAPAMRPGRVTLRSEPEFERQPAARQPSTAADPVSNSVVAEALAATEAPVIAPSAVPAAPVETAVPVTASAEAESPAPASAVLAVPTPVIAEPVPPRAELPPLEPRLPPIPARSAPAPETPEPAEEPPAALPPQESLPQQPLPAEAPLAPTPVPEPLPTPPPVPEQLPPPAAEEPPPAIHPRYEELPDDENPRRGEGLRRALRLLIALIFLAVVAAIIVTVVMDYRRGPDSALFGDSHATTVPAEPASTPTPPPAPGATPAPEPTTMKSAPQAEAAPAEPKPVQVAEAAPVTPPPVSDASPPAAVPAAASSPAPAAAPDAATGFADPLAYCQAVGTIDEPDGRFTGPAVPPLIGRALQQVNGDVQGPIHWRCDHGEVRACDSRGLVVCELTPTVDEMLAYCARHPDTKNLPAPNGSWSCKGKKPVIPADQKWPVDARGFYPDAWLTIKLSAK